MIKSNQDQHPRLNQESPLRISMPEPQIKKNRIPAQSHQILEFDWNAKWLKGQQYAHMLKNVNLYSQKFNFLKYSKKTHPQSIYSNPQNGMIYFVEANSIGSEFGFPRVSIKKRFRWKKMNFTTDLPKKRPAVTYIVASAVKCERFFPNSKNEGPLFRMHAVMLYKGDQKSLNQDEVKLNIENISPNNQTNYVLCHIRKLDANYKSEKKTKKVREESISQSEFFQEAFKKSESLQSQSQQHKSGLMLLQQNPNPSSFSNFFQANHINYFGLFQFLHNLNLRKEQQ